MSALRLGNLAAPREVRATWHIAFAMLTFGCALVLGSFIMADAPAGMLQSTDMHVAGWTSPLGTPAVLGLVTLACGFAASMRMLGTALRLLNGGRLLPQVGRPRTSLEPRVPALARA